MTRIGIAIVLHQGHVLVGIRPPNTVLAGLHEFPGGKFQPDESPAQCAARECLEETGLTVSVGELLDHRTHQYPHGDVELFFYECRPTVQNAPPAAPFQWIPLNALAQCNFPQANASIVQRLIHES